MPNILMCADTIRSPELRHEVPLAAPDAFIYGEQNGSRYAFVGSLEIPRVEELDGVEAVPWEELGVDELIGQGMPHYRVRRELTLRACRKLGFTAVVTPRDFPLDVADHLRANGIRVEADDEIFDARRRVKNEAELAGIRRAQRACERAMDAIRARLRAGGDVTSEDLHAEALHAFTEAGAVAPDIVIVSHGPQSAVGHEPGSGRIAPGEPIVGDLYPQDPVSGCFADMTRTFCLGEPPEELVRYHAVCKEALDRVYEALGPGATGAELFRITSDVFASHGIRTRLHDKRPGEVLDEGFHHALGHGVGLEVHEYPELSENGGALVAGDVIAIEPGCYRRAFGGCRIEDLVLVTEDGYERLTEYDYGLTP
jgi:Xaa-Pro aminopeptidase